MDYPDWLRPRVEEGVLASFTHNDENYDIVLERNYFAHVHIKVSGTNIIVVENLFVNNELLTWEICGKWLGLLGATMYDKSTDYELHDLVATLEDNEQHNYCVCLGGNYGGWLKDFKPCDFKVDFNNEIVVYDNGSQKTFEELFRE